MPGMVAFRRRWSVGSDDLVVPALFLIILHTAWILVLALIRGLIQFDERYQCTMDLRDHIFGYVIILGVCVVVEVAIAFVSLRGGILTPEPRRCMEYLLYARLVLGVVELAWLIVGAVWSGKHYEMCHPEAAKKALLGIMICNWLMILSCIISVWCTYDTAGAKWVKMKKYQDSMKERRRNNRRQSGSRRNWRQRSRLIREFFLRKFQRKAFRAYEESWDRRLQLLCCCVERKGRNKNSMSEIAQLFTEFFRDLDVVPSDIVAGLVLLRHNQKHRMKSIIAQGTNDVYQYLSGVPVTPTTRFLQLTQAEVMGEFIKVIHYMRYALAAYGWPVYVMMNPGTWLCRLLPALSCCCCCGRQSGGGSIVDDNCCGCNVASLKNISGLQDLDIIYATYHVDIGETPFFVALDHEFGKVVVCVRGTLSLQDVLTDLKAEPETLPLNPPRDDWQGHKGMVQAALYIKKKLIDDKVLDMAWERDEGRDVAKYDLVCVGHSLGAGTAAILAILLKADYPTLHCYSFSPPGGLLTLPCVEETKSYITSVVVGKDVVPRIGLPQLEMLRTDIINLIKGSRKSKWNIISKGFCCCSNDRFFDEGTLDLERDVTAHPSNSAIGLSAHTPLYPPGNMIHVVRSHAINKRGCHGSEAVYQALWASNGDFDEVLVSPTMINDHMPDNVLESLEKVLQRVGPQKPMRTMTQAERHAMMSQMSESSSATPSPSHAQGFLETSFTSPATLRHPATGDAYRNNATGSWDIAAQQILQAQDGPNGLNSASMPSSDESTASVVKPLFSLPLSSEPVHAPLASPETLSVASGIIGGSMASGVADVLTQGESVRDSLRRSLNSPPSRNSYRNSNPSLPARIEGVHVELSPGKSKMRLSRDEGGGGVADEAEVDGEQSTLAGKDGAGESEAVPRANPSLAVEQLPHDNQSECKQTDPSVLPSHGVGGDRTSGPAPSYARPAGENKADHSLFNSVVPNTHLPSSASPLHNSCPAPGDDDDVLSEPGGVVMTIGEYWTGLGDPHECMRHFPVETNQQGEYEHPNLHYSQASTGYPHGAYHPPIRYYHDDRTHPSGPLPQQQQREESPASQTHQREESPASQSQRREESPASQSQRREESPASQSQQLEESAASQSQQREESPSPKTPCHRATSSPLRRQPTPSVDMLLKSIPLETNSPPTAAPPPHPFVHCQSESSIFSKHFPPKLGMKRSAEQRDICHLEDETEVYPANRDLFTIKRSAEQRDIAHLGDDLDVFEEETEDIVGHLTSSRGRLTSLHSTPRSSTLGSEGPGARQGTGSQHASSSHSSRSDDVFESDLALDTAAETDV